ncbi:MAG: protein kinase [Myxococcales bacterium]
MTVQPQVSSSSLVIAGRFEVRERLTVDGFGEIFGANDRKTGKPVTLRPLVPQIEADARKVLKAIGNFNHANVVPLYGIVSNDNGAPFLVQGPIAGQHLAAFVATRTRSGKPISLHGAYNVVAHVCNALTAIHASGPHGAVRPSAVWMHDDGRVQLNDLLVARTLLGRGGIAGIPEHEAAYLAPELKAGGVPSTASDVFGLGALLYTLLTGRSPTDEFAYPSQVHPEASPAVDQELFRALAPDPAARHRSAEEFRTALLAIVGDAPSQGADDFGHDIEIEVNLASLRPAAGRASIASAPKAARIPQVNDGSPEVGSRVSIYDNFRVSVVDADEAAAARDRRSLGEVDLSGALAKVTEDDSPRWMVVKHGMDHGPFSGRQLVNMIVQGEALRDHELLNTDTGRRGKVGEFAEFTDFLSQYELVRAERERTAAIATAETKDKRSTVFKAGMGLIALAVVGAAGGLYALTRGNAGNEGRDDAALDMYKRGDLEISGSAGILPKPSGVRRSGGGGGGGGGGGMSYEDAMMQAMDIGSASGGGEQTLSAGTVAGVVNKNLNGIYGACVRGSVGKVKIDIAIAGSGQVMGVTVNAGDAGFQKCVADQVRRIRFPSFPAPRMGARYSFDT